MLIFLYNFIYNLYYNYVYLYIKHFSRKADIIFFFNVCILSVHSLQCSRNVYYIFLDFYLDIYFY